MLRLFHFMIRLRLAGRGLVLLAAVAAAETQAAVVESGGAVAELTFFTPPPIADSGQRAVALSMLHALIQDGCNAGS